MNIFFTSDTHFGHANVIEFCGRPFKTVEEMDEGLIERWNAVVGKHDRVFHLGDFAWTTKRAIEVRPRLNGTIRLIPGNHDDIVGLVKAGLFQRVSMWHENREAGFTATHVPLSRDEVRGGRYNVHGHKHNAEWRDEPHHINVCADVHGLAPVSIDWIKSEIMRRDFGIRR